ncbi:MAG: hypothetical protein U9R00_02970, partial [Patescibacteria group bacterium]|nr:hypothetical protein [Patescibacteria group bacterium]
IGILASIVLSSLNSARTKAKTAAFKAEMSSLLPVIVSTCDDDELSVVSGSENPSELAGVTDHYNAATLGGSESCGASGQGTFKVTITPDNGADLDDAILTESGVTFTPKTP